MKGGEKKREEHWHRAFSGGGGLKGREMKRASARTSGNCFLENMIRRQVLPQAPSPTMTSFRLISAMIALMGGRLGGNWKREREEGREAEDDEGMVKGMWVIVKQRGGRGVRGGNSSTGG